MTREPIIVFGALRSGTTLLRLMLDRIPGLVCPGESDYLFDYAAVAEDGSLSIDEAALRNDRIFKASCTTFNRMLTGGDAIKDLVSQAGGGSTQSAVLMLHRGLSKALALFPAAPVVHLLRDPRDVARSSIGMGWAGNVYHGVEHWIDTETEWDKLVADATITDFQELHYERLIEDTHAELRKLCEHIGVDYDPGVLRYHENSSYELPDNSLTQQWKRRQTARELGLVEGRLGPMLGRRNYESSGAVAIVPSRRDARQLWLQNKSAIWRFRMRKYGIIDSLMLTLSRRTGVARLGRGAQARIDRKLAALMK